LRFIVWSFGLPSIADGSSLPYPIRSLVSYHWCPVKVESNIG
jgi:hypothetical protein